MRDAEIDRIDMNRSQRRKKHLQKRFERKRIAQAEKKLAEILCERSCDEFTHISLV